MNDLEVEPLSVALGVHVVLQPEIVLNVVNFDGTAEVSTLKTRFENKNVILLRHIDSVLMIGLPDYFRCPMDTKFPLWCKFR